MDRSDSILYAALIRWGPRAQTELVFEEMAELQKELCKNDRGADNVDHIAEEIADVQIMLEQMMILHDCHDAVKEWRVRKLQCLEQRMRGAE